MIEGVGSVGVGGASTVRATSTASSASSTSTQASGPGVISPLSPRMTSDPMAGIMIMEYLSNDGDTAVQIPSTTVVAYLRSGLSETGTPVRDGVISVQEEA